MEAVALVKFWRSNSWHSMRAKCDEGCVDVVDSAGYASFHGLCCLQNRALDFQVGYTGEIELAVLP